jgi:hypothetical protein
MKDRFQFSEPEFELPDVESVLDALEAAVVGPETPMFDAARQSWQPVARHPEVRAAWEERARFRPPGTGLDLPPLPETAATPEAEDAARRRAAYATVVRGNRIMLETPAPEEPKPRRTLAVGLVLVIAALLVVGFFVVELAGSLVRVAARAVRMSP